MSAVFPQCLCTTSLFTEVRRIFLDISTLDSGTKL